MSWAGREERPDVGTKAIAADHFIVHPKVPAIAKLFVKVRTRTSG